MANNVLDLFTSCHLNSRMTDQPASEPNATDLAVASLEEVAEALSHALRYDKRGKPRRGGWDFTASLAAECLAEHLHRLGFIVMKASPGCPHSTGWSKASSSNGIRQNASSSNPAFAWQ